MQDVFATATEKIKNFEYDFSIVFAAWIFKIAQYMVRRHFDKKNPRKKLQYGFEEENDERSNEQSSHFDDHWLKEVLLVLTEHELKIFRMHYEDGIEFKEIGEKLNIDTGSARSEYFHARAKMRTWLEEHGIHKGDL